MASRLHPTTTIFLAALLLCASHGQAAVPRQQAPVTLSSLVKVGDVVTVTPWAGHKFSGEVVDVWECSFDVRRGDGTVTVPMSGLKTLRRHPPRRPNEAVGFMVEVAEQCNSVECAPASLLWIGLAASVQGIDDLFHQPRVVYRARRPVPPDPACAGTATTVRTAGDVAPQE